MRPLTMYRSLVSIILLLAITGPALNAQGPSFSKVTDTLKTVFGDWNKAMTEKDLALWQKSTAKFRQIGIRNMIVSQKNKWPEALFEGPVKPPNLSSMEMAKTMINGPTAQLVYFGKADFGIGEDVKAPEGLLFLMFIKEINDWKFSTSRFMNLSNAEEISTAAQSGDYSFLESPQFKPPGKVPPIPKLCPLPEMVGYLEIVSIGYETKVTVAERSKHIVINNVHKGLIIGGLKKGINPIFIETRSLNKKKGQKLKTHFEINIYREMNQERKPLKLIYGSGPKKDPGNFRIIVRGDG
ncbi:MAG TPA: hypothetical protein EYG40_07155 [Verrucomicrobia bacterium]|nr:hypothetical protein [Verrucomicrobiales bacterium]HIL54802.1 hypothetical protein [Verrucomicrobiota bacterium]